MSYSEPARTAAQPGASDLLGRTGTEDPCITVYGCEPDEADVFSELSRRLGVIPTLTSAAVSESGIMPRPGSRCISVGHKSEVDAATLRALKEAGVEHISTRSIGFDHIDLHAAEELGITVENVVYAPDGVADYTVMLMLMAIRQAKEIVSSAQGHDFRLGRVRGRELRDMTVGVLGVGQIGRAVIERLQGFGCRVLTHNGGRKAAADDVSLAELLCRSDVVTLHLPLDGDTYHVIGCEQIETMKPGAFLINTGRGALVDTGALIRALESGRLGGAALDVLEGEEGHFYVDRRRRPIDHPFLLKLQEMPNVIITPHTAYYTERALCDTVEKTIEKCLAYERGRAHA